MSSAVSTAEVGSTAMLLVACTQGFFLLRADKGLYLLSFPLADFPDALLFLRFTHRSVGTNSLHFLPRLLSQYTPLLHDGLGDARDFPAWLAMSGRRAATVCGRRARNGRSGHARDDWYGSGGALRNCAGAARRALAN